MIEKARKNTLKVFWSEVSTDPDDPCRFQAEMPMTDNFSYVGTGSTPDQAFECLLKGLETWSLLGRIERQSVSFQPKPEKIPS